MIQGRLPDIDRNRIPGQRIESDTRGIEPFPLHRQNRPLDLRTVPFRSLWIHFEHTAIDRIGLDGFLQLPIALTQPEKHSGGFLGIRQRTVLPRGQIVHFTPEKSIGQQKPVGSGSFSPAHRRPGEHAEEN